MAGAGVSAAASAAGGLVGSLNAGSLREPEDTEDGWMDGMSGSMDGTIIRRGAVNQASRNPFSSGLRPETAGRREEPARRGTVLPREDSARRDAGYQEETDREAAAVKTSTVMDDLVEMAASDDRVLKEELFSIDECLENVMVLQEPVCAKKRIKLELKKSVSMPDQAIGDKAKLQRALVSLLETAAEQTPQGGVINLGCRADRASGNRAYMYFTIRDNGSSIASDLMQGMFEMKDERDDPLRAGLYIAREIVSIMGGNVRVRSRRGEGTEFMVTVCMKLP
jgi:signal transduction histidine kinase